MLSQKSLFVFLIVVILSLADAKPIYAEVYVNRIWDNDLKEFVIKPLELIGDGVTWDRFYQNFYGEYYQLTPGPPFIFESHVIVDNIIDSAGSVIAFGSLNIRSEPSEYNEPFNLIHVDIYGVPDNPTAWGIKGPLTVEGSSPDPIYFLGTWDINTSSTGLVEDHPENSFDILFSRCVFETPTHIDIDYSALQFQAGNVTFEYCNFKNFSDLNSASQISFRDEYSSLGIRPWRFTMHGCVFQDNEAMQEEFIILYHLGSVTIENNHFNSNAFFPSTASGLVYLNDCGLKSIKGNTASNNTVNCFQMNSTYINDSARVQVSDQLPIVTRLVTINEGENLVVDSGSIIKVCNGTNFVIDGRMSAKGAVFTTREDDSYGGDTDLEPEPSIIQRWGTVNGGFQVDTTGNLLLEDCVIRYANRAATVYGAMSITECHFKDNAYWAIKLQPAADRPFTIMNTTISRTEGPFQQDGHGFILETCSMPANSITFDSVAIYSNDGDGIRLQAISSQIGNILLERCRLLDNGGHGVYAMLGSGVDSLHIRNCHFTANAKAGLFTEDYSPGSNQTLVRFENNIVAGNGFSPYYFGPGAILDVGSEVHAINNTVALNLYRGMEFALDDELQSSAVNNIFFNNGDYGYVMGDATQPLFAHNCFWENDGSYELYFRGPDSAYMTVEGIQTLGGEYVSNQRTDPGFAAGIIGTIDSLEYSQTSGITMIYGDLSGAPLSSLTNALIRPDTTELRFFYVAQNSGDSLWVVGNATEVAMPGDIFEIFDYHLAIASPLIDAGRHISVDWEYDIDGDERKIDGNEDMIVLVDVGADEFDPDGGPTPEIRVDTPSQGDLVIAWDTCLITWDASITDSVNIYYEVDYDTGGGIGIMIPIVLNRPADSNSYKWEVPDVHSTSCIIKIEDIHNADSFGLSGVFKIRNYELCRYNPDSTYDPYRSNPDGWQFPNDSGTMWPYAWWSQFDYIQGIDPYTGFPYPSYFWVNSPIYASGMDFPDWPLFVQAFGVEQCYFTSGPVLVHRPSAVLRWAVYKGKYKGSCAGFTVGSVAAFDDTARFKATFPEAGVFDNIYDLTINDERRIVINLLWVRQHGAAQIEHRRSNQGKRPNQTLEEIKQMFLSNSRDDADLALVADYTRNAHALVPYRLVRDAAERHIWRIYVYDPNYPGESTHFVQIDTSTNSWIYPSLDDFSGDSGIFLRNPASEFLSPPGLILKRPVMAARPAHSHLSGMEELFCTPARETVITAESGDSIGYVNGLGFNNVSGAIHIVPFTGGESYPQGYLLPDGLYSMRLTGSADGLPRITHISDSNTYAVACTNVMDFESAVITFGNSFTFSNPDTSMKEVHFMAADHGDTCEVAYTITNYHLFQSDSVTLNCLSDSALMIKNAGGSHTYGVVLIYASPTIGYSLESESDIEISPNYTHILRPEWGNPDQTQLKVLIDFESDGDIDDSTSVDLRVVSDTDEPQSEQLPYQFQLLQNYPNPFNLMTLIEYSLPRRSHVTIDVINVLGQKVRTLVDREETTGSHIIAWDGTTATGEVAATGLYLYRIHAGDYIETKKMLLLK